LVRPGFAGFSCWVGFADKYLGEELASRKTFLRFKARDAQTSSLGRLLPSRLPKPDIEKALNRTMFAPTVITLTISPHDTEESQVG